MPSVRSAQLVEDLGRIFEGKGLPPGDRALLDGFVIHRDEAAFEAIVVRHGPMVRGVCRRILADSEDVDDAFQATFLVLFLKSGRIGNADQLAPWLFGVATRVARKAQARASRRAVRFGAEADREAVSRSTNHDLLDVMPLIDAEIARLPAKLQAAVLVCLVEGASLDEAASRLGCPVGTVKSRLARGREALRDRLQKRGIAPSLLLAATGSVAPSPIPAALVRSTLLAVTSRTLAPTLMALARGVAPAMIAKPTAIALLLSGFILAGGGLTTTWLRTSAQAQQPVEPKIPPSATDLTRTDIAPAGPNPSTADEFARILAEYKAQQDAMQQAQAKATTRHEQNEIYSKMTPNDAAFSRRMIQLAETNPTDLTARDALLWVINKPYRGDYRDYGDEFARAAALLVRNHGDDPVAVSVGLGLTNMLSEHRDALLIGFYASARSREAKGIARLALAQYLEKKAEWAASYAGKLPKQGKMIIQGVVDDDGKSFDKEVDEPLENYAYNVSLSLCDPKILRADAEQLYNEVIADYGDVPWANLYLREMAAQLKEPEPKLHGRPMTAEERKTLTETVNVKRTLGERAKASLDEMHNIAPGKQAPEIEGMTLGGQPLKLSDFRGKVVVLVFWESGCGPCLREMPREQELADRLKGRPFALLGVDSEGSSAAGLKVVATEKITWPSWHDGGDHPIMARYHVKMFPSTFVIDAQGIIRHEQLSGKALDDAVDKLLDEVAPRSVR